MQTVSALNSYLKGFYFAAIVFETFTGKLMTYYRLTPNLPPLQDDYPLASLPLLGYSVSVPSDSENIHKDYVFKLHFKSHVYYFRSESEYTFERYRCPE